MSSDIYIDLKTVLTHPELFELSSTLNNSSQSALDNLKCDEPDLEYVKWSLSPVLTCHFKPSMGFRVVDIYIQVKQTVPKDHPDIALVTRELVMHISIGSSRVNAMLGWLNDNNIEYEVV